MSYVEGKVALVTGGVLGLGNAFAYALAAEGANVAICDVRDDVALAAAALPAPRAPAIGIHGDVSAPADVRRIVATTVEAFGRVDILVNNAGKFIQTLVSDPWEQSVAAFDELVATNMKGVFLCGRAVIPLMVARGGGHIVNIVTDHIAPPPGRATGGGVRMDVYDATKWAINGFTQAWSKALRKDGIRVNALCMDSTETPLLWAARPTPPTAEDVARWLRPEAVAKVLVELLDEGPGGRTGENIGVWIGHPTRLPRGG